MSSEVTLRSAVRAEWIKFRSVRSTIVGVATTFVLTIGLGAVICFAVRSRWSSAGPLRQATFDPVTTSLGGTLFAQFAVGVIGALFITSEYSSGAIRSTLAAVPARGALVAAKLVVLVSSIFLVAQIACFGAFSLGQSIFSGVVPTASLSTGPVLLSVFLGGVYLTALTTLGFALGLILRHSAACISVFTSLLLILPIVTFLLPQSWQNAFAKFEPSTLGQSMMTPTAPANSLSAGPATLLLFVYVAFALGLGVTMLKRRDA